jgi:hypothetical protein
MYRRLVPAALLMAGLFALTFASRSSYADTNCTKTQPKKVSCKEAFPDAFKGGHGTNPHCPTERPGMPTAVCEFNFWYLELAPRNFTCEADTSLFPGNCVNSIQYADLFPPFPPVPIPELQDCFDKYLCRLNTDTMTCYRELNYTTVVAPVKKWERCK